MLFYLEIIDRNSANTSLSGDYNLEKSDQLRRSYTLRTKRGAEELKTIRIDTYEVSFFHSLFNKFYKLKF